MDDFSKSHGDDRIYGIVENQEAVDQLIRKISTHFLPSIDNVSVHRHPWRLRDNSESFVKVVRVPASDKVYSILDDGTWMRGVASNREMTASEISDLSYRRGIRSAESEPLDVDFDLLNTDT